MSTTTTPNERAMAAAAEIAARGDAVTARAVREAAGVMMSVATAAAKAWNQEHAESDAPAMPPLVADRFDFVWRQAYLAARVEFDNDRAETRARAERAERELEALAAERDELEKDKTIALQERDAARSELADRVRDCTDLRNTLHAEERARHAAEIALTQAQASTSVAEAQAAAAERELTTLRDALDTIQRASSTPTVPAPRKAQQ